MHGTLSYKGSKSSVTFEGEHYITSSFGLEDSNHNALFTVHPICVTCSVDLVIFRAMFVPT